MRPLLSVFDSNVGYISALILMCGIRDMTYKWPLKLLSTFLSELCITVQRTLTCPLFAVRIKAVCMPKNQLNLFHPIASPGFMWCKEVFLTFSFPRWELYYPQLLYSNQDISLTFMFLIIFHSSFYVSNQCRGFSHFSLSPLRCPFFFF